MSMAEKLPAVFVTGFNQTEVNLTPQNVSAGAGHAPRPAAQATARPATASNAQTIPTPQGKPTMTRPTDAAILRELAAKTMGDSAFALNTNDLPGAAKRLRDALGYVERLMQATPATQPNGFNGYSINATNAHQSGDEFANYDMNNPSGEKQAPATGNAGQVGSGFASYSLNAVNKAAPVIAGNAGALADEFAGYDLNAHQRG